MGYADEYLATVAGGLQAYPEQKLKAAVYQAFLDGVDTAKLADALPPPLRSMVTDPEPVSAWIPEVHANVFYLTARDALFDSDEAYFEHFERINEKLLSGRLYRVMMMVASPSIVVRGAGLRWKSFHRGVTLHAELTSPNATEVHASWPHGLYPRFIGECYARAFLVALRLAGARDATMALTGFTATGATYHGAWR